MQQTTYTNVATSDLRLLGLPATILTAKGKIGDSSPWTEQTDITYDSNYNIVKKVTGVDDTNKISEESYTYDTFGNILTKSVKLYDSTTPLTASYKYSRNGNLLLETTDTYGRKTAYSYDAQGRLVAKNNHKNQVTRYEYDDMGNLIKTTHPDNVVETTSVAWNQSAPQSLYAVTRTSTLAPTTITYYSAFGKEVRKGMMQFDGKMTFTDTSYDQNGVLKKVSLPFTGASATLWNTYTYDEYGRPVSILYASGKEDKWSYYANSVTETRDGVSVTRTADATGKLTNVGSLSGSISYDYILGDRINSIVSNGIRTSFVYDSFGRQTGINDPSAGISTCGYDEYGNKATQTDARGETVSQAFDPYGKVLERVTPEGTFTYTYNADHLLATVTGSNGTGFAYTYDAFGNVLTEKETGADGKWLQKSYSYTNGARMATAYQSDSGMIGTESYTYANGYLKTVTAGNDVIWELQEVDAFGHATKVKTGDITRTYAYDAYGYPTARTATSAAGGTFLDSASVFDPIKGNLTSRTDVGRSLTENFEYDPLNTLTIYKDCGEIYDDFGKLWLKGDAGFYSEYDNYQVKGVTLLEDLLSIPSAIVRRNQDITYTSSMRPDSITENGYQAAFVHNGDNRRVRMQLKKDGNEQLTRHYLGNVYEVDETVDSVKEKLYLGGDYYNAYAVYMKQNGVWTMNYICRDYLGSITHITDAAGSLLAEYSYDAWGRQRNPATMEVYAPDTEPELLLGRGYTGHEHLPFFGLINMNARLYDPVLGLFLSPDPYVQLPDNPVNYNRYAYAMNNPMRYTDQSGEKWWLWLVGDILTGGVLSSTAATNALLPMTTGVIKGLVNDENVWKTAWQSGVNEVKFWGGLFTTDSRKSFLGQTWEMVSRFTWQGLQTSFGLGFAQVSNLIGQVDEVDYWGGATVISGNNWNSGAVTLGSYIIGNRNLEPDPNNYLFQHEYGHYLQSQEMGLGYIPTVGIPSLASAAGPDEHSLKKFEQDANRRAFNYFNKNVPGFYTSPSAYESQKKSEAYVNNTATGWNFYSNPLDINNIGVDSKRHYYDYNASGAINSPNMTLRMFWLKY